MLDGLSDVALSSEEDSVGAGGGSEGELVEGEALAALGDNALSGRVGESQSSDRQLRQLRQTLVVEDRADADNGLRVVGVGVLGLLDNSREGDRGSVDLPA